MKHKTHWAPAAAGAFALILTSATAAVVTFETVSLPPAGFWNGSDLSGKPTVSGSPGNEVTTYVQDYQIEDVGFRNNHTLPYNSWSGFAISNHSDTTIRGYDNQYSAYTGGGADGSANYVVGYYSTYETSTTRISFASSTDLSGLGAFFTNTTWTALDMLNGGDFGSKKFGGLSGNDPDWLLLTIAGYAAGIPTATVEFYLADFRFEDNSLNYIVTDWQFLDFTALREVDELRMEVSSVDGNTPSYFAMDNFLAIPEPSALLLALSGLALAARRRR